MATEVTEAVCELGLPDKTHVALGLGLAACQRSLSVGFTTTASLVHELISRPETNGGGLPIRRGLPA